MDFMSKIIKGKMKNSTYDPEALIKIHVESTTNIQAWAPVIVEMLKKDCGIIEVYSSVKMNADYTDFLYGTVDTSQYGIQIDTTVHEFKVYLSFFADRIRKGDTISVLDTVSELQGLIDEMAECGE